MAQPGPGITVVEPESPIADTPVTPDDPPVIDLDGMVPDANASPIARRARALTEGSSDRKTKRQLQKEGKRGFDPRTLFPVSIDPLISGGFCQDIDTPLAASPLASEILYRRQNV